MRITNTLFVNTALMEHQNALKKLYDIDQQLSSGLKIQQSFQDSSTYIDTMRLNYEIAMLEQGIKSSQKAQKFSQNTDEVLNQFSLALEKFKTKLIQANNATNTPTSLSALASELSALKEHMIALANTSINGQFLFSGSALKQMPIEANGNYLGNDETLKAMISSHVALPYNIDGKSLFLGSDSDYHRVLSTNVKMFNQTKLHPEVMEIGGSTSEAQEVYLTSNDTIRDMVGDSDANLANNAQVVFYLSGRKTDGETFAQNITLDTTAKVSDLLDKIGFIYGNTTSNKIVDVSMNSYGQIEIKDTTSGRELIQMHLFGAMDNAATSGVGNAFQSNIDDLVLYPDVKMIAFDESSFGTTIASITDEMNYTRRNFEKEGNELKGNVSQVSKVTNLYASASTALLDVAGTNNLDTTQLIFKGIDRHATAYEVTFNFASTGTFFSINSGTPFSLFDATGTPTVSNDVTYQQLMDVISMVSAGIEPSSNTSTDYEHAIQDASISIETSLNHQGQLIIKDKIKANTPMEFSLYTNNANEANGKGAVLSFMANDLVAISNPSIDFFNDLDAMIEAVQNGMLSMDSTRLNGRNIGLHNALSRLDHLSDHLNKEHTKIGAFTNALMDASERAEYLSLNVKTVRSDIIDTDTAEAYLKFNQISNSYQAMLSTIAKINSMSLLNYI